MSAARLIIDPPAGGPWNMAVDEYLLEAAGHDQEPILRLYQWSEPTLSLGYFQAYADRESHTASQDCRCVRRQTGGGAIVHHHELTYSLIVPGTGRWDAAAGDLYHRAHRALIDAYVQWGATCRLSEEDSRDAFLCFERRAPGDILCGEYKITGSAQRRHKQVTLQHGSILIRRSAAAPELVGLGDLVRQPLSVNNVVDGCTDHLSRAFGLDLVESPLKDDERAHIANGACSKFARESWTKRR